jgi:hypothetical protein
MKLPYLQTLMEHAKSTSSPLEYLHLVVALVEKAKQVTGKWIPVERAWWKGVGPDEVAW